MNRVFTKKIIIFILVSFLCLEGCEAFKKKFVRKKEKTEIAEEVVLEPQEYPEVVYDNFTLYKNYYNIWKAWNDELLASLSEEQSYKKQIRCFGEVLKNLNGMKDLLIQDKQKELESYIQRISENKDKLFGAKIKTAILLQIKNNLTSIEKNIRINFNFKKIKDLIKN